MKSVFMKKAATALAAVIVCGLTVGCTGTAAPADAEEETDEEITLDGAEIIFASNWAEDYCPEIEQMTSAFYTVEQENAIAWWHEVQTKLDCELVPIKDTDPQKVIGKLASGINYADIMHLAGYEMYQYAKGGYLTDLGTVTGFEPSDTENWNTVLSDAIGRYKGTQYGIMTAGKEGQIRGGMLTYNPELITGFNQPDPYEQLENRTWTFDTFAAMLKNCADTDPEHTVYALVSCNGTTLLRSAVKANGGNIAENGKFGYTSDRAVKAMDWAATVSSDKTLYKTDPSGNVKIFSEKRATFSLDELWMHLTYTFNTETVFDFIRFPYGPDAEYGTFSTAYNTDSDQIFTIPLNTEDSELTACVLTMLFGRADRYIAHPEYYTEEDWQQKYYSLKSYEEVTYLRGNMTSMETPYELYDLKYNITRALENVTKGSATATQAMQEIAQKVNTALEADE